MNTTTTAPDPGYYVPTPADCLEAGLIDVPFLNREGCTFFWPQNTIVDEGETRASGDYVCFGLNSTSLANMANLDEESERDLVFANRAACMAFLQNHYATSTTPSVAPAGPTLTKAGGYVGRIAIPSLMEESNLHSVEFRRIWDSADVTVCLAAAEPAPASDWEAFISEFDQITFSVDERMDFVLKTHYGACAVLFAEPTGDFSKLVDKTVTGFKDLQAKISSHLASKKTEGGAE